MYSVNLTKKNYGEFQENPRAAVSVQTSRTLSANSPGKIRLRKEVRYLKRKVTPLERREAFMERKEPSMSEKQFLQFCQNHFNEGPKVYGFLNNTFNLPSKSTLCRITSKWDFARGINDFAFAVISANVSSMNEEAKDCVLCIDEMSLKTFLYYHRSKHEIIENV